MNPRRSLIYTRLAWVNFLVFQGVCIAVYLWLGQDDLIALAAFPACLIQTAAAAATLALAWGMRSQTYKAHWVGNAITPWGYLKAYLKMGFLITVISMLGFLVLPARDSSHQNLGVISCVLFLVAMVFMFPNGKPMQDHPIRL